MVWAIATSAFADRHNQFAECLSEEDLLRLNRYTNEAARSMFLVSRGALRMLLGQHLNIQPKSIDIANHEHGKPFLPAHRDFFFNISHSRSLALIAFALAPVGVDVEFLQRQVDFAAVMRRFFSADEQADWSKNQVPSPEQAFFRGWTRKEAILKATGEGIAGLGHTQIAFAPCQPRALISRHNDPTQSQQWLFEDFNPAADYQAAVALQFPTIELLTRQFEV